MVNYSSLPLRLSSDCPDTWLQLGACLGLHHLLGALLIALTTRPQDYQPLSWSIPLLSSLRGGSRSVPQHPAQCLAFNEYAAISNLHSVLRNRTSTGYVWKPLPLSSPLLSSSQPALVCFYTSSPPRSMMWPSASLRPHSSAKPNLCICQSPLSLLISERTDWSFLFQRCIENLSSDVFSFY